MKIMITYDTTNGWINARSGILPQNGQICIGIYKYGNRSIGILQYREPDVLRDKEPYFLSLTEMWQQMEVNCCDIGPTFTSMDILDYWMPLELPDDAEEQINRQIREAYFNEEEEEN